MSSYLMIFGKPRYLGLLNNDVDGLSPGMQIVTESARGEEIAVAAGPITIEQAESYRNDLSANGGDGVPRGGEPAFQDLRLVRHATSEDIAERGFQESDEEDILLKGRGLLKSHELDMKLVDVEFLLDRKKLFFYFTAEQRIDFRAYVRDLAREFKTRIELRQIGVRDESKVVKGMSPCGMPCCCSYWLNRFSPICIRMVKEQNLALNPTKISGICGRLMCCMGFEHNTYRELWKTLPGPGSKIKAPNASYIVSGVDVAREKVRIYCPGSGEILVDIEEFQAFRETVMKGETWVSPATVSAMPSAENAYDLNGTDNFPPLYLNREESSKCVKVEMPPDKEVANARSGGSAQDRSIVQDAAKRSGGRRRKNSSSKRGPNETQKPVSASQTPDVEQTIASPGQAKLEGKKRPRRRRPKNKRPPVAEQ